MRREISQSEEGGSDEENWLRAERDCDHLTPERIRDARSLGGSRQRKCGYANRPTRAAR